MHLDADIHLAARVHTSTQMHTKKKHTNCIPLAPHEESLGMCLVFYF